jgi:hypothetical protein
MQIHELTQPRLEEGLGSTLGGLAGKISAGASSLGQKISPTGDFKAAYNEKLRSQQTKMVADKAYKAWTNYAQQLRAAIKDPAKLQAFDNRTDDLYKKSLTAFVQKNLLGGAYMPNLTNKTDILTLIDKLSEPKPVKSSTGGTITPTATGLTHTANPANPNIVKEALDPATEKDLFTQLVAQGTLSQTVAATGQKEKEDDTKPGSKPTANSGEARGMQSEIVSAFNSFSVTPKMIKDVGTLITSGTNGPNVSSTGNPSADALLIAMGFQGLE